MRVGIGYDIHPLVEGRPLFLGGVRINSPMGLGGHSDADVLVHAVCDALLGAAGEGDIGRHFPPEDDAYLNISSLVLLEKVKELLEDRYEISNVDCTVVAEAPRLAPYIEAMNVSMAACLGLEVSQVNVKATTNEGFGHVGEGRAIVAYAIACLRQRG